MITIVTTYAKEEIEHWIMYIEAMLQEDDLSKRERKSWEKELAYSKKELKELEEYERKKNV